MESVQAISGEWEGGLDVILFLIDVVLIFLILPLLQIFHP